jgi:YD repeat-containing protein
LRKSNLGSAKTAWVLDNPNNDLPANECWEIFNQNGENMIGFIKTLNGLLHSINYEVGKTYTYNTFLPHERKGLIFYTDIDELDLCNINTKIFRVEILGDIIPTDFHDMFITNKFKVIMEIPKESYNNYCKKNILYFHDNGMVKWHKLYLNDDDSEYRIKYFDKQGNITFSEDSKGNYQQCIINEYGVIEYCEICNIKWDTKRFDIIEYNKGKIIAEYHVNNGKLTNVNKYYYDKNNNTIREETYNQKYTYIKYYFYDEKNRLLRWEDSDYCWLENKYENDNLVEIKNSFGYWIRHYYDDKGNKIRIEDDINNWQTYEYNDNGVLIRFERSSEIIEKYNDDGELKEEHYLSSNYIQYFNTYKENEITVKEYKNSDGYWKTTKYNKNDQLVEYKDKNGDYSFLIYDDNGNLISQRDQTGLLYEIVIE